MAVGSGSNMPWAEGPANSYLEFVHAATGRACVDPTFFVYFQCSPASLPPFVSLLLPSAFPCCQRQGLYGPGDLHVLSLSACFPTTLCVPTLILSLSMLLGGKACVDQGSVMHVHCSGEACVTQWFFIYFHASLDVLPPFASLL